MPAVQAKINVRARKTTNEDNFKHISGLKTRNNDANTTRRTTWDRLSQVRPKNDTVTKSDTKRNSDSVRKPKSGLTAGAVAAKLVKKRQWDVGNAYSKLNQAKLPTSRETILDEISTSRSLFCLSPRREHVDIENINVNQLSENVFQCNELDDCFRMQFPDFEDSSEYEYQTPNLFEDLDLPCLASEGAENAQNSRGAFRHFKELLHQEETSKTNLLAKNEISLLKDIVRAEKRHKKLRKDESVLLKQMLMDQLNEISQQERMITTALKKIRSRTDDAVEVTTIKVKTAEQPMEDNLQISKSSNSIKMNTTPTSREEVDIIFKNIPSLENEIRILHSLLLKLEETLKKSSEKRIGVERKLNLRRKQSTYFSVCVSLLSYRVLPLGNQVVTDVAQEFQIRHQTIDELKLEREFFIPTDLDSFTLQRTNFDKLSRNPELLLQRMKPFGKGSIMKFNFIEQDPVFFNNFLAKMCNIYSDSIQSHQTFIPKEIDVLSQSRRRKMILGAGDQPDYVFKEEGAATLIKPLTKKKNIKYSFPPLSGDKLLTPKNELLKTVLVGVVQLLIAFTVLAAILYPDIICS